MLLSIGPIYLFLKLVWLFGLVKAQAKTDALQKHWLFLGIFYTAGVGFLSYVFLVGPGIINWSDRQRRLGASIGLSAWQTWLLETLILAVIYFKLLERFDEGAIFWVLIVLGIGLVLF